MLVSRVRAKEEGAVLWQAQLTKGLNIRTISAGGNGNLEPKKFPQNMEWSGTSYPYKLPNNERK